MVASSIVAGALLLSASFMAGATRVPATMTALSELLSGHIPSPLAVVPPSAYSSSSLTHGAQWTGLLGCACMAGSHQACELSCSASRRHDLCRALFLFLFPRS